MSKVWVSGCTCGIPMAPFCTIHNTVVHNAVTCTVDVVSRLQFLEKENAEMRRALEYIATRGNFVFKKKLVELARQTLSKGETE